MVKLWGVYVMDEHTAEPILVATHAFTRAKRYEALFSMKMLENFGVPARVMVHDTGR